MTTAKLPVRSRRRRKGTALRIAALLLAGLSCPMLQAGPVGLFYYVPQEESWQALLGNAPKISVLAPQVFTVDRNANVTGSIEDRVRELARRNRIPLMPLLVNEGFRAEVARAVWSNDLIRQQVISEALRLCLENECWGIQIDFEGLTLQDKDSYMRFLSEAAKAFRERKLKFSVAVPSPLIAGSLPLTSYGRVFGGFPVVPTFYDVAGLSFVADFVTLMTYDHYNSDTAPGPIGGYAWVEQSLRFLLQWIPPEKLFLGLGLYGRRWCDRQVSDANFRDVTEMAVRTKAKLRWHDWHLSPWFEYEEGGCRNIVWFENRRSLREKLRLVSKYRLAGFSAWRLGQEDPAFWKDVRRIQPPR